MNTKYISRFYILFIIIVLIVSACSSKKEDIYLGVVGTMTGGASDLAVSGRRGVEIATDEINYSGGVNGRRIELVIKNDKNDTDKASLANSEFVEEKVKFIIGHYTSGMQISTMDYINDKDVLFLSPTVSADVLTAIDDNFIRFIASTKEQAVVLAEVAKENDHKKFAVFTDSKNRAFNEPLKNNFEKLLADNGGQVKLVSEFDSGDMDSIIKLVDELEKYDLDSVFMIGNSASNAKLAQIIKQRSLKINLYAPLWANTHSLIESSGNSIEGMYIVGSIDEENKSELYSNFEEKYIERYSEKPSFASIYSYEAAWVLFDALSSTSDFSSDNIKNKIIEKGTFNGLQGNFNIDRFGDNSREYLVFKITNGELIKVK